MKSAFDTSALAKRYIEESGSEAVAQLLLQSSILGLCVMCVPEMISALNRRRREGALNNRQYHQIKNALSKDITQADILGLTPAILAKATILLENNVLRASDALHIACAIIWQANLFVSADERQITAAQNAGLKVQLV
jgi:predicted nucleic acid-binding protein